MSAAIVATTVADVQQAVREHARLLPAGGRTKPALSTPVGDVATLDLSGLRGILAYDPDELTVTALAGTPVSEVADALAAHDQHLPFDPPLRAAGATLGGVVASATSGAGAFRHGGVRDFVIGVRFVDGAGRLVTGGGKVVKNAAGFDLPKLMVGSLGRLAAMVELTFKVFPRPRTTTTAVLDCGGLEAALAVMTRLARGPLALEALELDPPGRVLVRLSGPPATRAERLAEVASRAPDELLDGDADKRVWEEASAFAWAPEGTRLVRVALTPRRVPQLDAALSAAGARARYGISANVAWIAWPQATPLDALDETLRALDLAGTPLTGEPFQRPLLGKADGGAFARRVCAALDPTGTFGGF